MNAPTEISNVVAMPPQNAMVRVGGAAMMLDNGTMDKMMRVAEIMATSKVTIPLHLQKSPGDCLAVVMQATTWGMNPFSVAQKTYQIGGRLGYESQLVSAVINNSGAVKDRFHFEWFGPWEKIIGKFKTVESKTKKDDNGNAKKYIVPDWDTKDEAGLGIKVWATIKGETEPRVLTLLMTQARTRNSTLWTEDPKQQIAYLAQSRWSRLYTPDVILGVYTPDELEELAPPRDMGPVQVVPTAEQGASDELVTAARAAAAQGKAAFAKFWNSTPKDIRPQLRHIRAELDQTAADFDAARTVETAPSKPAAAQPATAQPARKTLEEVMAMLVAAKNLDALAVAGDWIGDLDDPEERRVCQAKFEEQKFVLEME